MTDHADDAFVSLERKLAVQRPLPPSLRPRVLAAVDDLLRDGGCHRDARIDGERAVFVAGTAFAVALVVLLALVLPQSGADARLQPVGPRPLPSLVERAQAAGVEFEPDSTHAGQLATGSPRPRHGGQPTPLLRSIDSRRLLEGEL